MKIILISFTLSFIGVLSYLYTYYIIKIISNIISLEIQIFTIMFFSILLFIDNFSLVYDLQNINRIDNQEHIRIIWNQAIEIQ